MGISVRLLPAAACTVVLAAGSIETAFAEPVYLTCKDNLSSVSLAVDYKSNTVTSTNLATGQPMADVRGNSAHPAKVTSNQIVWTVNASTGQFTYTLSRLTGQLQWSVHDPRVPGTNDGGVMNCDVGAKPKPKF